MAIKIEAKLAHSPDSIGFSVTGRYYDEAVYLLAEEVVRIAHRRYSQAYANSVARDSRDNVLRYLASCHYRIVIQEC
jgi:hypothetical protein